MTGTKESGDAVACTVASTASTLLTAEEMPDAPKQK